MVTSTLGTLLLVASARGRTLPRRYVLLKLTTRAAVQPVVQVLANSMGLVFTSAIA